jgi:uncharacterized integral membrane protein
VNRNAYGAIAALVAVAVLLFVAYLFVLQNSARTTQLSLDLYFTAWQLTTPVSIPALIGLSFATGFLIAAAAFGVRMARLSRRLRKLEQEIALGGGSQHGERPEWR